MSTRAVAAQLGIGKSTVALHSPFIPPDKPKHVPVKGAVGRPPGSVDDEEYSDVIPIPFFPDDLPRLEKDPFWTQERLNDAVVFARKKLRLPPLRTSK